MEILVVLMMSVMIWGLFTWLDDDNTVGAVIAVVFASILLAMFFTMPTKKPTEQDVLTLQEIEYGISKCASFGGLKAIRDDDTIICADKTEIKPEKKVEAESET